METTFEEFLARYFGERTDLLDDDQPDGFDFWVSQLEHEDYMKLGKIYGREQFLRGMDHCHKITMKSMEDKNAVI